MDAPDFAVIGGGIVGAAVAFGLLERGRRVTVLDAGDTSIRAATANLGLVWVNGKGRNFPAYQRWTRRSATLWPELCARLQDATGLRLEYQQRGGLKFAVGDAEMQKHANHLAALREQAPDLPDDSEAVDRRAMQELLPGARFGQEVVGGVFCAADGHVNPLKLWRALRAALLLKGADLRTDWPVRAVEAEQGGFVLRSDRGDLRAHRVVLAAGLANRELAAGLGLDFPVRPERGQIMVTERMPPWMDLPGNGVRQTGDGTVMVGSSTEDTGFDRSATAGVGARMATRALKLFPDLEGARLVRQWAGLRVLSPDGFPVYARPAAHTGCVVLGCHSGVTLAGAHAIDLAAAIDGERITLNDGAELFGSFSERRFDVSQNPL